MIKKFDTIGHSMHKEIIENSPGAPPTIKYAPDYRPGGRPVICAQDCLPGDEVIVYPKGSNTDMIAVRIKKITPSQHEGQKPAVLAVLMQDMYRRRIVVEAQILDLLCGEGEIISLGAGTCVSDPYLR